MQPIGQLRGTRDRAGAIGKERRHLLARFQIPLGIRQQALPRTHEIGVMVDAREDVEQRPFRRRREPDAAGGDDGNPVRVRHLRERLIVALFGAPVMPLQLDERAIAAEQADEAIDQAGDAVPAAVEGRAADERHKPRRHAVEIVEREHPLALRGAELHARDQTAQIAIAVLRLA